MACGFPTTVTPAIQYGAIPVFVDIRPDTMNIDETLIEDAIPRRPEPSYRYTMPEWVVRWIPSWILQRDII